MLKYNYDERVEQIKLRKIYIFGCGELGQYVYKLTGESRVLGFIDNDVNKQRKIICGKKVYSLDEITDFSNSMIVIAVAENYYKQIKKQLHYYVNILEKQIVSYYDYLPVYEYYIEGKMFFNVVAVSVTQKCSLNCKYCSIMTPYLKEKKHASINQLKEDLDIFFNKYDLLGKMGIVGGEPFLYPELLEYISYIGKYRSRMIRKPQIVTNGTIVPNDQILKALSENDLEVSISDYRKGIPSLGEKIEKLIQKLQEYKIDYFINTVDNWMDFGYTTVDKSDLSEKLLSEFYNSCEMPCRLLRDKCLYQCANAQFAVDAGIIDEDIDNKLSLEKINDEDARKRAILFDLRYQEKGFLTLCKHCNGYIMINDHYIDVAEQV